MGTLVRIGRPILIFCSGFAMSNFRQIDRGRHRKLADGTMTGHPLDAMWGGIDQQLYGIDGGRSAIDRYC
jgi:hypothetical protein